MNNLSSPVPRFLVAGAAFVLALAAPAAEPTLLDDFSNANQTGRGASRFVIDDKGMGSQSHATQRCENGVLIVEGELVPGRGLPAFISVPLLLAPDAQPRDLSAYEGVRLRVKLTKGVMSVQVASADIQNYDFHAAPVVAKRGEFVEVCVPLHRFLHSFS